MRNMDKLPSAFNDLWQFLFIPVIELMILTGIVCFLADRPALKARTIAFFRNIPKRYQTLNEKTLQPLGIGTVFSIGFIIFTIVTIVAISRVNHMIGDLIPGTLSYGTETALIRFGDWRTLSKFWACHPYIESVHDLSSYTTAVVSKATPAYPELAQMLRAAKENLDSTFNWFSFEKFLLFYLIILIPPICSTLKIRTRHFFVKFTLLLLGVISALCLNGFHTYTGVKRITQCQLYACATVLAPELSKIPSDSAKIYLKKLEDYSKLTQGEPVIQPYFNYILE